MLLCSHYGVLNVAMWLLRCSEWYYVVAKVFYVLLCGVALQLLRYSECCCAVAKVI